MIVTIHNVEGTSKAPFAAGSALKVTLRVAWPDPSEAQRVWVVADGGLLGPSGQVFLIPPNEKEVTQELTVKALVLLKDQWMRIAPAAGGETDIGTTCWQIPVSLKRVVAQLEGETHTLSSLGWRAADMKEAGFSLTDLKAARFPLSEIQYLGYKAKHFKEAKFHARELRTGCYAAELDAMMNEDSLEWVNLKGVGYWDCAFVKSVGYSYPEMRSAGYSVNELRKAKCKIPPWADAALMDPLLDLPASQMDREALELAFNDYFDAATEYFSSRRYQQYRSFHFGKRTPDVWKKDLLKAKEAAEAASKKTKDKAREELLLEKSEYLHRIWKDFDEHHKETEEKKKALAQERKRLNKLIDKRKAWLEEHVAAYESKVGGEVKALAALIKHRTDLLAKINAYLAGFNYPASTALENKDFVQARAWRDRVLGSGSFDPSALNAHDREVLQHLKAKEIEKVEVPLATLQYKLDYLREIPEGWKSEIAVLESWKKTKAEVDRVYDLVQHLNRFLPLIEWHAKQVRIMRGGVVNVLTGKPPTKVEGFLGARTISITLGGEFLKVFKLKLVYETTLAWGDDRRLKSTSTYKIVPSVGFADSANLCKFLIEAGFVASSKSKIYLDEKHYAYETAFYLAHLLSLVQNFWSCRHRLIHRKTYRHDMRLWDPALKKLLEKLVGGQMGELQRYLEQCPVVSVFVPLKDGLSKPSVTFEAKAGDDDTTNWGGVQASGENRAYEFCVERLRFLNPDQPTFESWGRTGSVKTRTAKYTNSKTGEVTVTCTDVQGDPIPDNDGEYIKLSFSGGAYGANSAFTTPTPGEGSKPGADDTNLAAIIDTSDKMNPAALAKAAVESLGLKEFNIGAFQDGTLLDANFVLGTSRWKRLGNWVEWPGYHLQYLRVSSTRKHSLELKGDTPVGAAGSLGLAYAHTVALRERLGRSTLTYVVTIYNGLIEEQDGERAWAKFKKIEQSTLWHMFRQLAAAHADHQGKELNALLKDASVPNLYKEARLLEDSIQANAEVWSDKKEDLLAYRLTDLAYPASKQAQEDGDEDEDDGAPQPPAKPWRLYTSWGCSAREPRSKALKELRACEKEIQEWVTGLTDAQQIVVSLKDRHLAMGNAIGTVRAALKGVVEQHSDQGGALCAALDRLAIDPLGLEMGALRGLEMSATSTGAIRDEDGTWLFTPTARDLAWWVDKPSLVVAPYVVARAVGLAIVEDASHRQVFQSVVDQIAERHSDWEPAEHREQEHRELFGEWFAHEALSRLTVTRRNLQHLGLRLYFEDWGQGEPEVRERTEAEYRVNLLGWHPVLALVLNEGTRPFDAASHHFRVGPLDALVKLSHERDGKTPEAIAEDLSARGYRIREIDVYEILGQDPPADPPGAAPAAKAEAPAESDPLEFLKACLREHSKLEATPGVPAWDYLEKDEQPQVLTAGADGDVLTLPASSAKGPAIFGVSEWGRCKEKVKPAVDRLEEAFDRFLSRSQQVVWHGANQSWKRMKKQLHPPSATIRVRVEPHWEQKLSLWRKFDFTRAEKNTYCPTRITTAPKLRGVNPEDVWLDSTLRDAPSLLPFYRADYAIELVVKADLPAQKDWKTRGLRTAQRGGSDTVKLHLIRPSGADALQGQLAAELEELMNGAKDVRAPEAQRFKCLIALHPLLFKRVFSWFDRLELKGLTEADQRRFQRELRKLTDEWRAEKRLLNGFGEDGPTDIFEDLLAGIEGPISSFRPGKALRVKKKVTPGWKKKLERQMKRYKAELLPPEFRTIG
jgi:hypothetical protein